MKWPYHYVVSIAVHALVLFGLAWLLVKPPPAAQKHYLEITLVGPPAAEEKTGSPAAWAESSPSEAPPATASIAPETETFTPKPAAARIVMAPAGPVSDAGRSVPGAAGGTRGGFGNGNGEGAAASRFGEWDGHYYEIVAAPNGITWYDADAAARARGGYLAILPRPPTDEEIMATAKTHDVYVLRQIRSQEYAVFLAQSAFIFNLLKHPEYWRKQSTAAVWATSSKLYFVKGERNSIAGWLVDPGRPEPFWIGPWVGKNPDFYFRSDFDPNSRERREDDIRAWRALYYEQMPPGWYTYTLKTDVAYSYLVEYDHDPPRRP